ncbi:trypsin-like peptidase domain-containing protein [Paenibacillus apii]|uniref:trypsin-like peptidase domain-containing protein n=1 Tax=Paenibacillus apii TaxID=1850370 RepID=UPI001439CF6B|nr:trypsin-like peptidase domain-containing protein [Paenibacillus apii]NJJ37846.1 trypsin-like peptidase domain-containing protein [Paenibacillus apii]
MIDLEKWKKACVNIEGATDSAEYVSNERELRKRFFNRELSPEEYSEEMRRIGESRGLRMHGTAIYLKHEDKKYLITARHVLFDKLQAERTISDFPNIPQHMIDNKIFNIIFFRTNYENYLKGQGFENTFLMNLGTGPTEFHPYTFSPTRDIAIISLNRTRGIVDKLDELGYIPITLDDINDHPCGEGSDVVAIGFPGSTSTVGIVELSQTERLWASNAVSLPVISYGKVAMLHDNLDYYWADISIYPGNSGGPLIEDNKLVGIVCAQATVEQVRIPFGHILKSYFIKELLDQQIQKDANRMADF